MNINYVLSDIYTPVSYEDFNNAVVIIGYAEKGPSLTPVYISRSDQITNIFGEGSELSQGCLEAMIAGASRIIAFRINGVHPVISFYDISEEELLMRCYAINATEKYNAMRVAINTTGDRKSIEIYDVDNNLEKEYIYDLDTPISRIANRINYDASMGKVSIVVEPLESTKPFESLQITGPAGRFFSEGRVEDFLHDEVIYTRLDFIYSLLETINFDSIVSLPIRFLGHANVPSLYSIEPRGRMFYNQLQSLCSIKRDGGYPITAIIPSNDHDFDGYTIYIKEHIRIYTDSTYGLTLNESKDIVVVKAWVNSGNDKISNGCCIIAGLLSDTKSCLSPANKPIHPAITLQNEFDVKDIQTLSLLGICTFKNTIRNGVVLANAVTSLGGGDSLRDKRLSDYIHKEITTSVDHYVGEAVVSPYNSVDKLIDNILNDIRQKRYISDYIYSISTSEDGLMNIDIQVIPYGEIKTISALVAVEI